MTNDYDDMDLELHCCNYSWASELMKFPRKTLIVDILHRIMYCTLHLATAISCDLRTIREFIGIVLFRRHEKRGAHEQRPQAQGSHKAN